MNTSVFLMSSPHPNGDTRTVKYCHTGRIQTYITLPLYE